MNKFRSSHRPRSRGSVGWRQVHRGWADSPLRQPGARPRPRPRKTNPSSAPPSSATLLPSHAWTGQRKNKQNYHLTTIISFWKLFVQTVLGKVTYWHFHRVVRGQEPFPAGNGSFHAMFCKHLQRRPTQMVQEEGIAVWKTTYQTLHIF